MRISAEVTRVPGEAFARARAELRARMQGARHLLVVTDTEREDRNAERVEASASPEAPQPESEAPES